MPDSRALVLAGLVGVAVVLPSAAAPAAPVAPPHAAALRALHEARMHAAAGQWNAVRRVLTALRHELWLAADPACVGLRVRVEFVLWDLRMGLLAAAHRDLEALCRDVLSPPPARAAAGSAAPS
jgi:hypothetical protein